MSASAAPGGRATLDFFAAQANARHRTAWLVISFALAFVVVVAVVYAAVLVLMSSSTPGLEVVVGDYTEAPRRTLFQPTLLLGTAAVVAAVIGLGSAYHAMRLSAGGGDVVAAMLGGSVVDRGTQDPAERRLVNVVEEMSIAAGMPVPRLYALQQEGGINAFAAGYTPGHSVVAVTRGALDRLNRDELQGVVAHELSHLLNGDTRIDLRLMAAIGGLTALALVGRLILNSSSSTFRSRGRGRGRGGILLVGLAFLVAGGLGALCGKLVRYAVARQREWLADASAMQFTRNPDGLAGALRKIAQEGSAIGNAHAGEAAHLFFASHSAGFFSGLLSTHPPIEERIRRLAPYAEPKSGGAPLFGVGALGGPVRSGVAPPPASQVLARGLVETAGAASLRVAECPAPEHVSLAAGLLEQLTPALSSATREPFGARAIACALLLDRSSSIRERQLAGLDGRDSTLCSEVERLAPMIDAVARTDRMALLSLALPALDGLSPKQSAALGNILRTLIEVDGTVTPFELAVKRMALRRLARGSGVPPRVRLRMLDQAQPECLELLSSLAWIGARDPSVAQAALDAGVWALGIRAPWRLLPREKLSVGSLEATLAKLDEATADVKGHILGACVAVVLADTQVTAQEAELVCAIAASLGLPVPPVVSGKPATAAG